MEAPNLKQAGLDILEDTALAVVEKIVKPYAHYYAAEKGGVIGEVLAPFIDNLVESLQKNIVDKIDGQDEI